MQRLLRWAAADPVHAALTIGFGSSFSAYTLELLQRASTQSAATYVYISITALGLLAISQSQRCARMLVWLGTDQVDRRS